MNMRPNFLFIGPDKCGSSWLFEVLRQHHQCYVPACKDIYFFDRYYERGLGWYLSFFGSASNGAQAIGELSHDYLFSALAAERIKRDLPEVKLLTCLRNPVERTYSHYTYLVRSGMTREPFALALEHFPQLIRNSLYDKHLLEYFKRFDRRQIKILFFDDLQLDPESFAASVLQFLNLPFLEGIDYHKQVRPASRPRNFVLARMVKLAANLARDSGFPKLVGSIKHSRLTFLLYKPYSFNGRPSIDPVTRSRLEGVFRPTIEHLQDMLEVDLSRWLTQQQGAVL
jgi:hypothetical protein